MTFRREFVGVISKSLRQTEITKKENPTTTGRPLFKEEIEDKKFGRKSDSSKRATETTMSDSSAKKLQTVTIKITGKKTMLRALKPHALIYRLARSIFTLP